MHEPLYKLSARQSKYIQADSVQVVKDATMLLL